MLQYPPPDPMEDRVEFSTFRKLLQSIENSDVSIRVRMLGEGWMGFSKVILLSESAMILQTAVDRKVIMNLRNAVEFEIDQPIEGLPPNTPHEILY